MAYLGQDESASVTNANDGPACCCGFSDRDGLFVFDSLDHGG